jgi:cytidine deaminase
MLQGTNLEEDAQLINMARTVCGEFSLRGDFTAGSVGAAIRTAKGNIYTGICIDLACGLGFCAEVAAVAEMLKHRETHIATIVAVSHEGVPVGPCGRCREMIAQVDARNLESRVLLGGQEEARLSDLLPQPWLKDVTGIQT